MFDPFKEKSSAKGFVEYSQQEISSMLASNELMSSICEVLANNNSKGYIVGEYVRHLYMGEQTNEAEIVVFGDWISVAKELKRLYGKKCYMNIFKNYRCSTLTFYRSNSNYEIKITIYSSILPSTIHKQNIEYFNIEDYLVNRDFTIQGIALSLNNDSKGELCDPCNGMLDIIERNITTIDKPTKAFKDAPQLILESFALESELDYVIMDECYAAIKSNISRIDKVKNSYGQYIQRIISTKRPSKTFVNMYRTGVLNYVLPELANLNITETRKGFTYRNDFYHSISVLDAICRSNGNIRLRFASILIYIGKPQAKKFDSEKGWSFHGTDIYTGKMLPSVVSRLKLDASYVSYIKKMALLLKNLNAFDMNIITDSAIRRLIGNAENDLDDLLMLYDCSNTTDSKIKKANYKKNFEVLLEKIDKVKHRDLKSNLHNTICINGHKIKELFPECAPSQIGRLKAKLTNAILDGVATDTYESLYPLLMKYAKQMGLEHKDNNETVSSTEETQIDYCPNNEYKIDYRIKYNDYCLTLHHDGSYIIENICDIKDDKLNYVSLETSRDSIMLQCYESGIVNKVALSHVFDLRKDFTFKNGLYKEFAMSAILTASEDDILLATLSDGIGGNILLVPLSAITLHTELGLKGKTIIDKGQVKSWHIINGSEKVHFTKLLEKEMLLKSVPLASKTYKAEIDWIKTNVLKNETL